MSNVPTGLTSVPFDEMREYEHVACSSCGETFYFLLTTRTGLVKCPHCEKTNCV